MSADLLERTGIDAAAFDRDGFAIVRFLPPQVVAALHDLTVASLPRSLPPFYASPAHGWGPGARDFHRACRALLDEPLAVPLPHHRVFMVAATVKAPRGGLVQYHQDWTYTDERVHRPLFLWVPLVDVDATNGALRIVPGSHRHAVDTIRPSIGFHGRHVTEPFQDRFERRSWGRDLAAGETIAFDPATVHGSPDNLGADLRPSVTIALVPRSAPLVHFHQDPDGTLTGHAVDEAFFTEHDYAARPTGYPPVVPWTRAIEEADFDAMYPADQPSPGGR